MEARFIPIFGLLTALHSAAKSQTPIPLTPTLVTYFTGDVSSQNGVYTGQVSAAVQGPGSPSPISLTGNIQWFVSVAFVAPQGTLFVTNGSASYGIEKSVSAIATNSEIGGSASASSLSDALTAQATIPVGTVGTDAAPGSSVGYPYTINGSDITWTYFGSGTYTGTYTFLYSLLEANASLNHPQSRFKDDGGQATAGMIASLSGNPISNTLTVTVQQ